MRNLVDILNEGFYGNVNTKEAVTNAKLAALFDNKSICEWVQDVVHGLRLGTFVMGVFLMYLIKCCFLRHKDLNPTILVANRNNKEIFLKGLGDIYNFDISPTQRSSVSDIEQIYKNMSQESRDDYETMAQDRLKLYDWIIANGKKYKDWFLIKCTNFNEVDCSQDFIKIFDKLGLEYFEINLSKSGHAKTGKRLVVQDIFELIK